ncbi:MAG TPA: hypothetical protein VI895_03715 [Bdellovibrionota bacterium]|nr:hypothetical protein [Bdellovibrionota bacterium]
MAIVRHRWLRVWIVAAALGAMAFFFFPVTNFQFVSWDDQVHVYRNPIVLGNEAVSWHDRLLTPSLGYPIPVTILTYQLEHKLFDLDPRGFHATNVVLHLASCLLLFILGRALGLGFWGAFFSMMLFGLHPVVSEPVSWVSGRKDLLALFFSLGATLLVVTKGIFWKRLPTWAAAVLYLLAIFSKPTAVFLPLFWGAVFWFREKLSLRKTILRLSPLFLISISVVTASLFGQSRLGSVQIPYSPFVWLREVWYGFGFHARLLFFVQAPLPKQMAEDMPPPFQMTVDLFPLLAITFLVLLMKLNKPPKGSAGHLGLWWGVLSYLPSSNLIPLTRFLADSYVYFPLVGFSLFFGDRFESFTPHFSKPLWRTLGLMFICSVFVLMAIRTTAAILPWRDSVQLWQAVYQKYPDRPYVCRFLGDAYGTMGDYHAALLRYDTCGKIFGRDLVEEKIELTRRLRDEHRPVEEILPGKLADELR